MFIYVFVRFFVFFAYQCICFGLGHQGFDKQVGGVSPLVTGGYLKRWQLHFKIDPKWFFSAIWGKILSKLLKKLEGENRTFWWAFREFTGCCSRTPFWQVGRFRTLCPLRSKTRQSHCTRPPGWGGSGTLRNQNFSSPTLCARTLSAP